MRTRDARSGAQYDINVFGGYLSLLEPAGGLFPACTHQEAVWWCFLVLVVRVPRVASKQGTLVCVAP